MHETMKIYLKPGRERSVVRRHPWVFSGAVARAEGQGGSGAVADVFENGGAWLARGLWNPSSALCLRLATWREEEVLDRAFFRRRLERALALRTSIGLPRPDTDACRLVFAEADGVPGLVVDRYAGVLAVRIGTAALLPWLDGLVEELRALTGIQALRVDADPEGAAREGMEDGILGRFATNVPDRVEILENGARFVVDWSSGQKTGFFLDQRENRLRTASWAPGRRVLSAYCYTGAFEVVCARAGASEIMGLDSAEPALVLARQHHALNPHAVPVDYRKADVPVALRRFRDEGRTFDLVILDPPRFVMHRDQLERGLRAYKDINLLAIKLLTEGGILATFSCSGRVGRPDFENAVRWAAADAGREVRVLERFSQPADHPVPLAFPEAEYLKGLLCRVD